MKKGRLIVAIAVIVVSIDVMVKAEMLPVPSVVPAAGKPVNMYTENCCGRLVPAGSCSAVCSLLPNDAQIPEDSNNNAPTMMGSLVTAREKISEIDMNKDFASASGVINTMYTGSKTKGKSDSVVYLDAGVGVRAEGGTREKIAMAAPGAVKKLAYSVPRLNLANKDSNSKGAPIGQVGLLSGVLLLLKAGRQVKKSGSGNNQVTTSTSTASQVSHSTGTANGNSNYSVDISAPTAGTATPPVGNNSQNHNSSNSTPSSQPSGGGNVLPHQSALDIFYNVQE